MEHTDLTGTPRRRRRFLAAALAVASIITVAAPTPSASARVHAPERFESEWDETPVDVPAPSDHRVITPADPPPTPVPGQADPDLLVDGEVVDDAVGETERPEPIVITEAGADVEGSDPDGAADADAAENEALTVAPDGDVVSDGDVVDLEIAAISDETADENTAPDDVLDAAGDLTADVGVGVGVDATTGPAPAIDQPALDDPTAEEATTEEDTADAPAPVTAETARPARGWRNDPTLLLHSEPIAVMRLDDGTEIDIVIPAQRGGATATISEAPALGEATDTDGAGEAAVEFDALLEGTTLHIEALDDGAKLTYEHHDLAAARGRHFEALRLPDGWGAVQNGDAIDIVDADGASRFAWTGGPVWDASPDAAETATAAKVRLVAQAEGVVVARIVVPRRWIQSDQRVAPVFVDPLIREAHDSSYRLATSQISPDVAYSPTRGGEPGEVRLRVTNQRAGWAYKVCLAYQIRNGANALVTGWTDQWIAEADGCLSQEVRGYSTRDHTASFQVPSYPSTIHGGSYKVTWKAFEKYGNQYKPIENSELTLDFRFDQPPTTSGPGAIVVGSSGTMTASLPNANQYEWALFKLESDDHCQNSILGRSSSGTRTLQPTDFDDGAGVYVWCVRARSTDWWLEIDWSSWAQVAVEYSDAPVRSQYGPSGNTVMFDEVNAAIGNWSIHRTDVALESLGPDLSVSRTYNSLSEREGSFGTGWISNIDTRVDFRTPWQAYVVFADGSEQLFYKTRSTSWAPPTGVTSELTTVGDELHLITRSGDRTIFDLETGRLVGREDRFGNRVELSWNAVGGVDLPTAITDVTRRRTITLGWQTFGSGDDARHRIVSASVPSPATGGGTSTWTYQYGSSGRFLTQACDARPAVGGVKFCEKYTWSATHLAITDVRDHATSTAQRANVTIGYQGDGRVQHVIRRPELTEANRSYTRFAYSHGLMSGTNGLFPDSGATTTVTDSRGHQWVYDFNKRGQVTEQDAPDLGGGSTGITTYTYDDETGRRLSITGPVGHSRGTTSFEYDDNGNITKRTDASNYHTYYWFDDDNNLTHECPHRSAGSNTHPSCTVHTYDANDLRIETRTWQASGVTVSEKWTYNSRGQVLTYTDPRNRVTRSTYSSRGLLTSVTQPSGFIERFSYDVWDRERYRSQADSTGTAATGMRWVYFDVLGRAIEERGPRVRNEVTLRYHQLRTQWFYDANGRVSESWSWDSDKGVAERRQHNFGYDRMGREVWSLAPAYVNTSGATVRPRITRRFDAAGNVVEVCDARSVCSVTAYNARNLPYQTHTKGVRDNYTWYWDSGLVKRVRDAETRDEYYNYDKSDRPYLTRRRARIDGAWEPRWTIVERVTFWSDTDLVSRRTTGGEYVNSSSWGETDDRFTYTENGLELTHRRLIGGSEWAQTTNTFERDGTIRRTVSTHPGSSSTTDYQYDANGHLSRTIEDPGGLRITTSQVNGPRGNPLSVTDARNQTTNFSVDVSGRVWRKQAPSVPVFSGASAVSTTARPTETYGYDAFGNQTHVRDARGFVTTTSYDNFDRVARVDHPLYDPLQTSEATVSAYEQFWYDANGNLVRQRDRRGTDTNYRFDDFNRVDRITEPRPAPGETTPVTTMRYDRVGNVIERVDPTGAKVTWTYDRNYQPLTETQHVRAYSAAREPTPLEVLTTRFTYDRRGNLTHVRTPHLIGYSTSYDLLDRVVEERDGDGQATSYDYNVWNQPTRIDRPGGFASTFRFDGAGRVNLARELGPNGTILDESDRVLDAGGNVTREDTRANRRTEYRYDALGRLEEVRVAGVRRASYGYDAAGNLALLRDGRNNMTLYRSNAWNQQEQVIEPWTSTAQSVSDRQFRNVFGADGQTVKRIEPRVVITSSYDDLGRLRRTASGAAWQEFDYDAAGRTVATRSNGAGEIEFGYDDRGLLRESSGAVGTSEFRYDWNGRLIVQWDPSHSSPHRYSWTSQDELASHVDPVSGKTWSFEWNHASQLTTATAGNAQRRRTYQTSGRLSTDQLYEGSSRRSYANFVYDADGNVITSGRYSYGIGWSRNHFGYDTSGRLTAYSRDDWNGSVYARQLTEAYGYDAAGNRTTRTSNGVTESWTFDQRNRITSGPEGTYQWDPRGTLARVGNDYYDFDGLGQMTTVRRSGAATVRYRYDGLGRLATRTALESNSFTYAGFITDPATDGDSSYGRSPSGMLTGLQDPSGDRRIVGLNRHGDVTWLANSNGRPTETMEYDPWGTIMDGRHWGADEDPLVGFQGDWTDPQTGDVNMGARWYAPSSATFRARDAYSGQLTTPVSLNRYTYANNNPKRYWDPTGFCSMFLRINSACPGAAPSATNASASQIARRGARVLPSAPPTPTIFAPGLPAPNSAGSVGSSYTPPPPDLPGHQAPSYVVAADTGTNANYEADETAYESAVEAMSEEEIFALCLAQCSDEEKMVLADAIVASNYNQFDVGKHNDTKYDGNVSEGDFKAIRDNKHGDASEMAQWAAQYLLDNDGYQKYKTQQSWWDKVKEVGSFVVQFVPFYDCFAMARDIATGNTSLGGTGMSAAGCAMDFVGAGFLADAGRVASSADEAVEAATTVRRGSDELAGAACSIPANSFVPGTGVLMADGSVVPIEDVGLGDLVWAVDPETGDAGPREVLRLIEGTGDKTLVDLEIDGVSFTATDEHPIWVDSEGRWVDAIDVQPGDYVLDASGVTQVVDDVDVRVVPDQTVHNLTVDRIHTFFVAAGETSVLTHNTNPRNCPIASEVPVNIYPTSTHLSDVAADVRSAGQHAAARNQRVIAIGEGPGGRLFAGSSNSFDASQRAMLDFHGVNRVPGSGALHAEEELLRGVPGLRAVGTSRRGPCGPTEHNCAFQLIDANVPYQRPTG